MANGNISRGGSDYNKGRGGQQGGPGGQGRVVENIVNGISSLKYFSDMAVDNLVEYAEKAGEYLCQINLKTNQIRKFLDAVKKIESECSKGNFDRDSVKLLKPKLAYAAGRQKEVKPLMQLLDPAINKVNSIDDFKKFARFVESIVAYHKFYGGRD
ncbi:hypothetical protein P378_05020 [Desulforamulus profundi]|uniref:CRISPR system Cms protein Csm2 n=1 Tax=Desulforamulus profundi TaxID=1383067 RepID=A0A2C6MIA9_9FIRM|nr:type III-A CRISPR-associated protein Csm2 [Desulforamulus profundi]PHJ39186.1 hypothetical protein P378_05020 [Desulforamulus profundi]